MSVAAETNVVFVDNRWTGQHGIGRYAREVLSRLGVAWSPLKLAGRPSSPQDTMRLLPLHARRRLIYTPAYNAFASARRQLLTVHDLIHLETRGLVNLKYRAYYNAIARPIVRRTGAVVTVSETSKRAIAEWLQDDSVRIVNAGIGVSADFSTEGWTHSESMPYMMYVGNLRAHKNVGIIMNALRLVPSVRVKMVIPAGEHPDALDLAGEYGVRDRVDLMANLTDAQLAEMYRGAAATLMPSTQEGFGLPPLESIFCGTPVIHWAGCAAVAETVGDSGLAVENHADAHAWAEAITSYSESRVRVSPPAEASYSWERTANIITQTIRSLEDA